MGGDFRPYEVVVGRGLLGELGARVAPLAKGRTVVVTDETVATIHGPAVLKALEDAGVRARLLAVPAGEGSKSFAELERVLDRMLAFGLDRSDVVVSMAVLPPTELSTCASRVVGTCTKSTPRM